MRKDPVLPSLSILVADDNRDAATGMQKLLQIHDHSADVAFSGGDVVRMTLTKEYSVVLLDIGLPDIDGYDVARKLRQLPRCPLIIAISGYGQEEDKKKASLAGFDLFLTKPVRISDVLGSIARAHRGPRVLLPEGKRS